MASLDYLAQLCPFDFSLDHGARAFTEKGGLGTNDAETVEQIRENPYLQYFLGLSEYSDAAPFDASMFVYFDFYSKP
jgi:hypothetical protein